MDYATIATIIGTAIAMIAIIYTFLRNFKEDINSNIDRLDKRIDKMEMRFTEVSAKMDQRVMETNKRMDGVYNILLSRIQK